MAVPGTDLRSIPDYEPIPALYDMEAVEATGGKASDIGNEGEKGMNEEMMALIQKIGPEVVMTLLQEVANDPGLVDLILGKGGQEQAPQMAPGAAPGGPMGALSGLTG